MTIASARRRSRPGWRSRWAKRGSTKPEAGDSPRRIRPLADRRSEVREAKLAAAEPEERGRASSIFANRLTRLRRGGGEPVFDLLGILFVESVGELAERMADDDAKFLPVRIGNASLEVRPVHVKGAREIALHAKDGIAH